MERIRTPLHTPDKHHSGNGRGESDGLEYVIGRDESQGQSSNLNESYYIKFYRSMERDNSMKEEKKDESMEGTEGKLILLITLDLNILNSFIIFNHALPNFNLLITPSLLYPSSNYPCLSDVAEEEIGKEEEERLLDEEGGERKKILKKRRVSETSSLATDVESSGQLEQRKSRSGLLKRTPRRTYLCNLGAPQPISDNKIFKNILPTVRFKPGAGSNTYLRFTVSSAEEAETTVVEMKTGEKRKKKGAGKRSLAAKLARKEKAKLRKKRNKAIKKLAAVSLEQEAATGEGQPPSGGKPTPSKDQPGKTGKSGGGKGRVTPHPKGSGESSPKPPPLKNTEAGRGRRKTKPRKGMVVPPNLPRPRRSSGVLDRLARHTMSILGSMEWQWRRKSSAAA